MEICGTGMLGVQLGQGYGAGGLNQIGLMGEQLVAVDVEQLSRAGSFDRSCRPIHGIRC